MKFVGKFLFLLALLPFGNASAITLDFFCATGNNASNCNKGEQQFSVDVMASSLGGTQFTFKNDDPGNSISFSANLAIAEIYFESSLLTGIVVSDTSPTSVLLAEGSGVDFTLDKLSPGNLPGHQPIGFNAAFGTESIPGIANAIGEGEILTVTILTLLFPEFTAALADDFRIGLHVHRFADGGSESFVTAPLSPVPVPAAFWLFGTALIGFIGMSRRTKV